MAARRAPRPSQAALPLARLVFAVCLFAIAGLGGCKPKIGDSCTTSTDCSVNGDRLCDTSQPDGYCTVFNCEPDSCPEGEAICVAFDDMVCGMPDPRRRFARTFCMAVCDDNSDCRSGYQCIDVGNEVVDTAPPTHRVCLVPMSAAPPPPDAEPSEGATVCDAGPLAPWDAPETPPLDAASEAEASAEAGGEASVDATTDATPDAGGADADGSAEIGTGADAASDAIAADGDASGE